MSDTATATAAEQQTALAKVEDVPRHITVTDAGEFQNLMDSQRFNQLWRVSRLFASSEMVPAHFRGKEADCFVAAQMALRLGVDPFMFLQNTYVIQGRPAMQGALALSLINTSGMFAEPLRFIFDGEGDNYGCKAVAKLKSGEIVEGPKVTWAIVKAEGWSGRNGSKWKTIPDLMFRYRAAAWFGRTNCPERLMGMQTVEEVQDIEGTEPRRVEARVLEPAMSKAAELTQKLKAKKNGNGEAKQEPAKEPENAVIGPGANEPLPPEPEPPHPADEDQSAPPAVEMPKPCPLTWIVDRAASVMGVEMNEAERILKLTAPKPWEKLTRDGQEHWYRRMLAGEFKGK